MAARVNPDGSAASVIKYELKKEGPLYLYFRQDELVQWGDISVLMRHADPPKRKFRPLAGSQVKNYRITRIWPMLKPLAAP